MKTLAFSTIVVLVAASSASAESLNVAIGPTLAQPSSSYGAAGLPGFWNSLVAAHNTTTFNLKDLNGNVTDVNVWQFGGTELRSSNDPGTSGDDQTLLNHCLITYTPSLETCLFFRQLDPADYEVTLYAWMPNRPDVLSYTNCDEEAGNPHSFIGGSWSGHHQLGVTYSRHIATVTTQFNGLLRIHSGIAPGEVAADGAACNGVQIRQLPPKSLADMNCDGSVNGADIRLFVEAVVNPEAYYQSAPTCRIDNGDTNNDTQVTVADTASFVAAMVN